MLISFRRERGWQRRGNLETIYNPARQPYGRPVVVEYGNEAHEARPLELNTVTIRARDNAMSAARIIRLFSSEGTMVVLNRRTRARNDNFSTGN